ncbi:MAG: DNA repair protein RecO [Candidatus Bipolaricaulota bacterium]|nr:DNA repair protein RecO [Candidatus Bipolaricaulota bacterium]MDW8126232.1 DNA repair protein RecO [Candidatus Bipolaricaulota bacterium]
MAELFRDRALVLRAQDHAETDRIVSVLSENRGQLEILVKGARRIERSWGAILDILNLAEIIYYRRRSGLHLLREAWLIQDFPGLRVDLPRLEAGLILTRWARELVPHEFPDPRPFRLTLNFLRALEEGGAPEVLLRAYELRLLSLLGYRPVLNGCLSCGGKEGLTWAADRGGLLCRKCGGSGEEVPSRVWNTMGAMLRLSMPALLRLRIPEDDLNTMDSLIHAFRAVQLAR